MMKIQKALQGAMLGIMQRLKIMNDKNDLEMDEGA
jgi:hypothetical protein